MSQHPLVRLRLAQLLQGVLGVSAAEAVELATTFTADVQASGLDVVDRGWVASSASNPSQKRVQSVIRGWIEARSVGSPNATKLVNHYGPLLDQADLRVTEGEWMSQETVLPAEVLTHLATARVRKHRDLIVLEARRYLEGAVSESWMATGDAEGELSTSEMVSALVDRGVIDVRTRRYVMATYHALSQALHGEASSLAEARSLLDRAEHAVHKLGYP